MLADRPFLLHVEDIEFSYLPKIQIRPDQQYWLLWICAPRLWFSRYLTNVTLRLEPAFWWCNLSLV